MRVLVIFESHHKGENGPYCFVPTSVLVYVARLLKYDGLGKWLLFSVINCFIKYDISSKLAVLLTRLVCTEHV